MGTLQGSVSSEHLQSYFDEWVFRFNRRHSRSRALLFYTLLRQAVDGAPMTYQSMRKTGRTRPAPAPPPELVSDHRALKSATPACPGDGPELPTLTERNWGYGTEMETPYQEISIPHG